MGRSACRTVWEKESGGGRDFLFTHFKRVIMCNIRGGKSRGNIRANHSYGGPSRTLRSKKGEGIWMGKT